MKILRMRDALLYCEVKLYSMCIKVVDWLP